MTIVLQPSATQPVIQVNGRYEYVEAEEHVLGKGAYGTVFIGHDNQTDNKVAIKKVPSVDVKPDELHILQQLDSDLVVGLRDDEKALRRGSVFTYMIMDLLDTDLNVYLSTMATDGVLSLPDLDTVALGVANGYLELFRHDVIHRDIKPHNILLTYKTMPNEAFQIKTAKLSDFGISRVGSPTGSLKNIAGSPSYMAPEIGVNILDEQAYDAQVDMWSIGVVLNECATGKVPFDESALCRMFLQVTSKSFGDLELVFADSIPDHYQEVIRGLLKLDPTKRPTPEHFYAWAHEHIHSSSVTENEDTDLGIENLKVRGNDSIPIKIFRFFSKSGSDIRTPDRLLIAVALNSLICLCFGSYGCAQTY